MKVTGKGPRSLEGAAASKAYAAARKTGGAPSASTSASQDASAVLGIPEVEFTPRVRDAIMKLMAEVERLRHDLAEARVRLEAAETEADRDALLPILNRRAFVRELSRLMSFGERYGLAASLVYIDLDGFKAINDRHGHAAGDAALHHVARFLAANVRESDLVGRLGGDEFGLVLAKADEGQARAKARTLCDLLAASPLQWQGEALSLALTFGVHAVAPGESPEAVMAGADRAMYLAKSRPPGA